MIAVNVADLKSDAEKYLDAVARGETVEVCRDGKPVAVLVPVPKRPMDRWRRANPWPFPACCLARRSSPTTRRVPDAALPRLLSAGAEIDGGDLLPGFRRPIADLFVSH